MDWEVAAAPQPIRTKESEKGGRWQKMTWIGRNEKRMSGKRRSEGTDGEVVSLY